MENYEIRNIYNNEERNDLALLLYQKKLFSQKFVDFKTKQDKINAMRQLIKLMRIEYKTEHENVFHHGTVGTKFYILLAGSVTI